MKETRPHLACLESRGSTEGSPGHSCICHTCIYCLGIMLEGQTAGVCTAALSPLL